MDINTHNFSLTYMPNIRYWSSPETYFETLASEWKYIITWYDLYAMKYAINFQF